MSIIPRTSKIKPEPTRAEREDITIAPPLVQRAPVITPTSWRSGQELANKVLGKPDINSLRLTALSTSIENAKALLKDLEEEDERITEEMEDESEEEEEEIQKSSVKLSRNIPVNPVKHAVYLSGSIDCVVKLNQKIDI